MKERRVNNIMRRVELLLQNERQWVGAQNNVLRFGDQECRAQADLLKQKTEDMTKEIRELILALKGGA